MSKTEVLQEQEVAIDMNTKYAYVLSIKNEKRGKVYDADGYPIKDPDYPPMRNLLLRSSIVWPGGKDPFTEKPRKAGKYPIRFYDGCTSLFIDDQPKEREVLEGLMSSTRELYFIKGYLYVYGYDAMLKTYMDWCSWNELSPYRVGTIDAVFKLLDSESQRKKEAADLDVLEKAMKFAKEASVKHMRTHAKYLDIPDVDLITSQPLSDEAIRTEYRKTAMHEPARFVSTYNDKTLHIKVWIQQALANGEISTSVIPNKAVWKNKGVEICGLSGITSKEGILNKLIEFSQLEEGGDFKAHLEALNK